MSNDISSASSEPVSASDSTAGEKPLFIPLRTWWFRQFQRTIKDTEYRAYGPRWNENTCRVGRRVMLSHGYSGARMEGFVGEFRKMRIEDTPPAAREIYPNAQYIAAIKIVGLAPAAPSQS